MIGIIAHPTLGCVQFPILADFRDSDPERASNVARTIDGASVHQTRATVEADRVITGTIRVNNAGQAILLAINAGADYLCWIQSRAGFFKGYIKSLPLISATVNGHNSYSLTFNVTEKIS